MEVPNHVAEEVLKKVVQAQFDSHSKSGIMITSGVIIVNFTDSLYFTIKYGYSVSKKLFKKKKIDAKLIDIVVYKELDDHVANRLIEINATH